MSKKNRDARRAAAKVLASRPALTRADLTLLASIARKHDQQDNQPVNNCMAATRLWIDLMGRFGLRATARPVWARAMVVWRYGAPVSDDELAAARRDLMVPAEFYLEDPDGGGLWGGHLVAAMEPQLGLAQDVAPTGEVLIDLSASQMSDPRARVEGPLLLDSGKAWLPWNIAEHVVPLEDEQAYLCGLEAVDFQRWRWCGDWRTRRSESLLNAIIEEFEATRPARSRAA